MHRNHIFNYKKVLCTSKPHRTNIDYILYFKYLLQTQLCNQIAKAMLYFCYTKHKHCKNEIPSSPSSRPQKHFYNHFIYMPHYQCCICCSRVYHGLDKQLHKPAIRCRSQSQRHVRIITVAYCHTTRTGWSQQLHKNIAKSNFCQCTITLGRCSCYPY